MIPGRLLLFLTLLAFPLRAHDVGLSTVRVEIRESEIGLAIAFAPADARAMLPNSDGAQRPWDAAEFSRVHGQLEEVASVFCRLGIEGGALAPLETRVERGDGDNVSFVYRYPISAELFSVAYEPLNLRALPATYRQHLQAFDRQGKLVVETMLSAKDPPFLIYLGSSSGAQSQSRAQSFWAFCKLGVEHIWTGYDHLLFLFGLLVVCRSFRSIVTIITCFTLAHSLTLAVATFGWVALSSRWVEPAIAASIVFVGAENLVRRGAEPKGRALLTFGFGLVHGFGFASVLKDLGVGASGQGVALPLVGFNLGVEAGQVVVAAIVLPVVWRLRKIPTIERSGVAGVSWLIVAAGLYWFTERVFFG